MRVVVRVIGVAVAGSVGKNGTHLEAPGKS
jgi:hypothetical protein